MISKIKYVGKIFKIPFPYLSAEKARDLLGWKPLFSSDEGLKNTIAWYKEFLGEKS